MVRQLRGPCRLVKDEYFYFVCLCVYVCAQVYVHKYMCRQREGVRAPIGWEVPDVRAGI